MTKSIAINHIPSNPPIMKYTTHCFLVLIFAFLLFTYSCSDKYKTIYASATIPVLSFNHDSINIREKDSFNIASMNNAFINPVFWLYANPSPHTLNIVYSETSGKVHFFYRDEPMEDSKPIIVAGDSTSLFCRCEEAGIYPVDFFLMDQLSRMSTRTLIVNCLGNDKAKANLAVSFIDSSQTDNWQYRFDASATIKKYGVLTGYYFNINNQPVFSPTPVIDWIFHSRGEQKISTYATDDLKLNSDTAAQKIIIP
jgi:hypothetical protein